MTVTDIVIYLGFLPLTAFGFLIALRWAWRGVPERIKQRKQHIPAQAEAESPINQGAKSPVGLPTGLILGTYICSSAGKNTAELLETVESSTATPQLDSQLIDSSGLPVFAARISDLNDGDAKEALQPLYEDVWQQQPQLTNQQASSGARRALFALREPMESALMLVTTHFKAEPDKVKPAPLPSATDAPIVRIILNVPASWTAVENAIANSWLLQLVHQHNLASLTGVRSIVQTRNGSSAALLLYANQLLTTLEREQRDDLVILACCDSLIDPDAVDAMERNQTLFSATSQPKGNMPGEAAVVLIAARPNFAGEMRDESAAWPMSVWMYGASNNTTNPLPVDVKGAHRQAAHDLLLQALSSAAMKPSDIQGLLCDASQHNNSAHAACIARATVLPDVEHDEQVHFMGTATGYCGIAQGTLLWALTAQWVHQENKPAICLALNDANTRFAAALAPRNFAPPSQQIEKINS